MYPFGDIDLKTALSDLIHIVMAFTFALPIGWNRERADRSVGLRTFPLIAMAACGFVLVARDVFSQSPDAQARVLQGIITGIGFLGGGAIVKRGVSVLGTATAASVWGTAALGTAVAFRRYEIAALLSIVMFITLQLITPLKRLIFANDDMDAERTEAASDADES